MLPLGPPLRHPLVPPPRTPLGPPLVPLLQPPLKRILNNPCIYIIIGIKYAVHMSCTMLFNRIRTELMGMYFKSLRKLFTLKVSRPCSAAGSELNSWGCVFNPLEFHLRCEGFIAMLCSRVRAELVGMYFQSLRIPFTLWRFHGLAMQPGPNWTRGCIFNLLELHLRCEGFMALLCSRVRAELVGMYFQSTRIPFTLWRLQGLALQPGPSWTRGDVFSIS